uniref:Allophycocyanin gamma subunit n=1 Tax=Glaucocystis incrassata TaxID=1789788 RepID=A0A3G1IVD4_9EUKA|nr:allophycocyanin gamma subunit [Glaucocystis incrassata]ASQ40008.1 allophycocyanin gamma subunit [Glaucocystis incrassata]
MSLVTQLILAADDELRYLSSRELQILKAFLKKGEEKISLINSLAQNEKVIIEQASKRLWQIHPEYISPGGNAYGARQRALCLRDYGWYLRLVTYGILAGDKEPIEKIGIIGVREMYNSLGVPVKGMIDAITALKESALSFLNESEAEEVAPYFDYIVQAMS